MQVFKLLLFMFRILPYWFMSIYDLYPGFSAATHSIVFEKYLFFTAGKKILNLRADMDRRKLDL